MSMPTQRAARRLVAVLFIAQCLSSAALIANIQMNPIIGAKLGGSPALAGVAGTLLLLGAAVSAHVSGRFMQRYGRRLGLGLGFVVGACGMLLSGLGVLQGSFALFLLGVTVVGAAAIVAGTVFFVREGRRAPAAPVSVSIAPSLDGASLVAAGRF